MPRLQHYLLLLIIFVGYWQYRRNCIRKNDPTAIKESVIFISFMKRFGISLLILIVAALIVRIIVQSFGNHGSSRGVTAFIILPFVMYLMSLVWKK